MASKDKPNNKPAKPVKELKVIPNLTRGELIAKGSKDLEAGEISVWEFGQMLRLSEKEIKYCELYTSREFKLDGEQAAMMAFDIDPTEKKALQKARVIAKRLGNHQGVCTLITALLTSYGWNVENIRKQHMSLIEQNADLKTKFLGIKLWHEVEGTVKKDQNVSIVNNIDITVYNQEEKKKIRDMLYKGMGKQVPQDEEINFEELKDDE